MLEIYELVQKELLYKWNTSPELRDLFYAKRPNITPKMLDSIGVGVCTQENAVDIIDILRRKEYSLQTLELLGLIKVEDDKNVEYIPPSQRTYEFTLKNRYTIPLCINAQQPQIISFAGRAMLDNMVKWKNLKNSPTFSRSEALYPEELMNWTRKSAVLVEGYMDAVAIHGYGCDVALSILGIQITTSQVHKLLSNGVHTVHLMLDGDLAGAIGTLRTILQLKAEDIGIDIYLVDNDGKDPDELGEKRFGELMANGRLLSDKCDYTQSIEPLELLNNVIAMIDINDPKMANIMKGGGWTVLMDFCSFFAYQFVGDTKIQLMERFGKNVSFKRTPINFHSGG